MEPIEMAALGRPLYPGMLYDCRRDSFIPGVTLWDKASLTEDLDKRQQPHTDLKFSSSDSLREKASALNVSATLKASFLSGLVEVGGSAKYLNDQKSSARQSRVTLQYRQTTRYEQLTMTQLGKITYPQVFEERTATHVITAVLYGAQVFMVFDKTASENENKQEIEGNLHMMVKKIPLFSIEGEGALQMNDNEKDLAENISCTFYGDCRLKENPTTYMEALQLYKKLPSLLEQREADAVPVRVWLHPLACLDNRAAKLRREISATLISEVEAVLEDLGDVERTYNDLVKHKHVNDFQEIRERLQVFRKSFSDYKVLFQKALCRLLPAIRGGEAKEEDLAKILLIHSKSPFSNIKKWLENVQSELNLLNSYICELSSFPIITSSAQFNSILFHPMVDTVVSFTFTSLKNDPYLSAITKFVRVNEFEKLSAVPESCNQDSQAWFNNPTICRRMKENLFLFKSFAEANKDREKTRFIIASISDPSNPGTSIHLYKQGELVNSKFQPVSKPPAPSVDVQDRRLALKLQKSPTGETVRFRVEHRIKPDDSGADAEDWEVTDTPDAKETFTLTGLQLANQCWVRYRAVSDVGVSEASDSVYTSSQGKTIVPVGQSWDGTTLSLCNGLRSKILTSLSSSWWSLSTIQSEVTNLRTNISLPYVGTIPAELTPGMALYFQGYFHLDNERFTIKCEKGPQECDDVALEICFSSNFLEKFVNFFRSNRKNIWLLPGGSAFDIFIVIRTENYEVFVNDESRLYNYCVPNERMTTLHICGDVFMNTIGIIPNWSTSTFGKELSSETSRSKLSIIQSGVEYPICSPSKPYSGPITAELRAGLIFFFQGGVPSDSNGFAINLKSGPDDDDDIAFQFNPCFGENPSYCNCFTNGEWESPEEIEWNHFSRGRVFDMFMAINLEGYEVIVNGFLCCKFKHRTGLWNMSTLNIFGDVFMNTIGISESKPYSGPITGGLRAGLILFFQGGVHSDSNGFVINLKSGPNEDDDVAFHFNSCSGEDTSVCNSFRDGK